MRTVWKHTFSLRAGKFQQVEWPHGATIVHVSAQAMNQIDVWFDVNTTGPKVTRLFCIVGTGHPVPVGVRHVGTVLDPPFVWHLYEVPDSYRAMTWDGTRWHPAVSSTGNPTTEGNET